jgi:C1A family cysteine protease
MKLPEIKINLITLFKIIRNLFFKKKQINKLGCIPDVIDDRDIQFKIVKYFKLPVSVDLSKTIHWVYNQGKTGSCTANGIASAFKFCLMKNSQPDFNPSRLFIYYNARDDKNNDTGASIRTAIKQVVSKGVCDESVWPYIENKFDIHPSKDAYKYAEDHQIIRYERIQQTEYFIKNVLASGHPIVCGLTLFPSFMAQEVADTGIVPMPKPDEKSIGGHCVLLVGYIDNKFCFQNSWGTDWGKNGFFTVPKEYVLREDLARDFWVIYLTE